MGVIPPEEVIDKQTMAKSVKSALRDPVWQFVGAILAVVSIAVALIPLVRSERMEGQLDIVHYYTSEVFKLSDQAKTRVKLSIDGKDKTQAHISYQAILVSNRGPKNLSATDFVVPLTIAPSDSEEVIFVETLADDTAISSSALWEKTTDGKLAFTPKLLNSGDALWIVAYIDRTKLPKDKRDKLAKIGAKVTGVNVVVHKDIDSFIKSTQPAYLPNVEIRFSDAQVVVLVALIAAFFVATLYLADLSGKLATTATIARYALYIAILLASASTGEIAAFWFTAKGRELAPICYPLLVLHVIFALWLARSAYLRRNVTKE